MKTTFVIRGGELVEKQPRTPCSGVFVGMSDIQPFRASDGTEISSRSKLREYERTNGVRQVGNDWPGSNKPAGWSDRKGKSHGC